MERTKKFLQLFLCLGMLSCVPGIDDSGDTRNAKALANSPSTLSPGYGRILHDNPVVLSGGNYSLSADVNLGNFLKVEQDFITSESSLSASCSSPDGSVIVSNCFSVLSNNLSEPLGKVSNTWGYSPDTESFLEVNTFGHIDRITDLFHSNLSSLFDYSSLAAGSNYFSAIPGNLYTSGAFWFDQELVAYSSCDDIANAFFRPSDFTLCFGDSPDFPGLNFSEDPTVIHHEMGHVLSKVLLNSRGRAAGLSSDIRADLGVLFYDEAGAIGEGIADYFSFMMNQRSKLGEWALGAFYQAERPMEESQDIHYPGISTDSDERLSYPKYLNYNITTPSFNLEDVHNAGMIVSHYLVALTRDLESTCSMSTTNAINTVSMLLMETLMEAGDLSGAASDQYTRTPNINYVNNVGGDGQYISKLWAEMVNPPNFRSFFQRLAKFQLAILNKGNQCNGGAYSQDRIEQLLDEYGLLLFKTYNENGNGYYVSGTYDQENALTDDEITAYSSAYISNTTVDPSNRIHSLLISKDKVSLDPRDNATQVYIFDEQEDIFNVVSSLVTAGIVSDLSSRIPSDLGYNNGNGKISPGEIFGLSLNLYNNSNTTMAGVQVLANDWDHVKYESGLGSDLKPCQINGFPLVSEGAVVDSDNDQDVGNCNYITKLNGKDDALEGNLEATAPICLALLPGDNETSWVLQSEYADHIEALDSHCLNGETNRDECFIRAVKGADHAYFSKIDPNQTWGETFNNDSSPEFQVNNIILFEISDMTPPGTTFRCRFRVRFTNCDECWHNSSQADDDWADYEYAGPNPYEVIDFQFRVLD